MSISERVKFTCYVACICIFVACTIVSTVVYSADNADKKNVKSLIVIDPGHSPMTKGAKSCTGVYEYLYNDYFVSLLNRHLNSKNISILKTREYNEEVGLENRAKLARNNKLFLSIHHDSVQKQYINYINGNPHSTHGSGYSIFVSRKNENFSESLRYAQILGRELKNLGLRSSTHHGENISGENKKLLDPELGVYEYNDLIVLKKSKSPAILLEVAVIVNPEDEEECLSSQFQNKMMTAIEKLIANVTADDSRVSK